MMAYMGTVTVILLNILIAQMSTTYTQAKKVARLEYDVDRILQLTRMERFPFLVSIHEAIKSRYDMTPGAIAQMCCTPRTSVNEGVEGEGHWFIIQPFSLCRIYAWSITKRETGSVKWNLQKVGNEINETSY